MYMYSYQNGRHKVLEMFEIPFSVRMPNVKPYLSIPGGSGVRSCAFPNGAFTLEAYMASFLSTRRCLNSVFGCGFNNEPASKTDKISLYLLNLLRAGGKHVCLSRHHFHLC